ncbi:MAG: MFS transporter [Pseudomonadota bacterium]
MSDADAASAETQVAGAAEAADTPGSDRYKWYVLGVLTLVYTFNFVDRQIIAILSPAIKEELGLSDSMLGALKGLAFVVLYTALGIPIAWAADRFNRVNIVAAALAIWSSFTALSGLAGNALQLAMARIGVGIGEAGCSPPAHSLISDYFPKEKRAGALAIYSMGIPFGQMFAFLAGGWMLQELGWRYAFFLVGIPGVLLAIIMRLTVREPIRGASDGIAAAPVSLREGVGALASIPSFWGITTAVTLASFTGYGTGLWIVDFYRRTYELSYLEITLPLALLNGVAYGIGTFLGGWLTDRAAKTDKGAYGWIPALGMLATIPAGWLSVWSPTALGAFLWSAPFLIGLGMYLGPSFSIVQTLAPVRMRAFATALFFFILNLIALGGAPLWVGALSDILAADMGETTSLRVALTTLGATSALSAAAYYWSGRRLPADWTAAEQRNEGAGGATSPQSPSIGLDAQKT